jgi:hypothetical protein
VTASRFSGPLHGPAFAGAVAILFVCVGLVLGLGMVVSCSENVSPYTTRGDVCGSFQGENGYRWWLAVLGPPLLLLLSQAVPWFRRHAVIAATTIALGMGAFWTYVLIAVN